MHLVDFHPMHLWLAICVLAVLLLAAILVGMRCRLIPEWRMAWRFTSVQAAALLALLSLLQAEVLPLFQFAVPDKWWPWVTGAFGVVILVVRLIAQPGLLKGKTP